MNARKPRSVTKDLNREMVVDEPKKATTPAPPPSYIVPSPATEKDLVAPTRKTYSGPLAVGYDLMSISIGERITIEKRVVPVE
jgi:hypothetical protein